MFSNLKVAAKLGFAFFVVIALTMALAGVSLNRISAMNAQWQGFESVTLAKRTAVTAAIDGLGEGIHYFKNYIIRGKDYDKKFAGAMDAIDKHAQEYRALGTMSVAEEEHLKAVADAV